MDVSRRLWETRYRLSAAERSVRDTWRRVARHLAAAEAEPRVWARRFAGLLAGCRFLPGGRILAGAGGPAGATLFNCFVMGTIEDSLDGIFRALREGALTLQAGGGVGYDFSTLRPAGMAARTAGTVASGPVSFLQLWDSMCATVLTTGTRRGAMMGTLRCDHPDVERFVDAKREPGALARFNLSVLVTEELLAAVAGDRDWPLVFPVAAGAPAPGLHPAAGGLVHRRWSGGAGPVACRLHRVVRARDLWRRIARAAYDCGEPGVLFIDRINRLDNLWYRETIDATNPCGEVPLPPYGACDLGSINLTRFVRRPFTAEARFDLDRIDATARLAVRLLDDVIDRSPFPLERQRQEALGARRIGLGVTGLADALVLLGLDYRSEEARRAAAAAVRTICHEAYRASAALATEKGSFPHLDPELFLRGEWAQSLPADVRAAIAERGLRNSHLTAIAPAGSISLLAGNVSSGIEPIFARRYRRRRARADGSFDEIELTPWSLGRWRAAGGEGDPPALVTAAEISPGDQLAMQAALQPFVDQAVSKTIQVPAAAEFDSFAGLFGRADALGLKGCTAFRVNPVRAGVLIEEGPPPTAPACRGDALTGPRAGRAEP